MTMTIEETRTSTVPTLTLTEKREEARRLMHNPPDMPGQIFSIPAGYRVIEDTDYRSSFGNDLDRYFLVTGVDREHMTGSPYNDVTAGLVGTAVSGVRRSAAGDSWYAPGYIGISSSYVTGAWMRHGVTDAELLHGQEDFLACFSDGTIGRRYADVTRRPARRSLELVHTGGGPASMPGLGIDFNSRDWVPVEAVEPAAPAEAVEEVEAKPFADLPAGWKVAEGAAENPSIDPRSFYWLDTQKKLAHSDGGGVLWEGPELNDRTTIIEAHQMRPWIEVVRDDVETNLQSRCPYPNVVSAESPLLGLGDSADPELDPEPVAGGQYVAWAKGWAPGGFSVLLACCQNDEGTLTFTQSGHFAGRAGVVEHVGTPGSWILTLQNLKTDYHWVKAVPSKPEHDPEAPVNSQIHNRLTVLNERKDTYSDALNELAEDNGWCSEFESVVQTLGFPGRDEMAKDYSVELEVTFSMTDSGPSSWMDRRVETEVFSDNVSSLSLTEMTFEGTLHFTMTVEGVKPVRGSASLHERIQAAIKESLSETRIESALDDLLPGSTSVSSWEIRGFEEDEG